MKLRVTPCSAKGSTLGGRSNQLNVKGQKAMRLGCFSFIAGLVPFLAQAQAQPSTPTLNGAYFSSGVFVGGDFSRQTIPLGIQNGQPRSLTTQIVTPSSMAGMRLGWGRVVQGGIYLGAELEGSMPFTATVSQTAVGTEFRAKSGLELAGFGRLGWSPDDRNLIFVRAGAISLNRSLEAPQFNYRSGPDNELAPAFGIGAEIAVTDRVSFRMDLTHARGSGETDLKIFQGAIGLSYRF